MYPITIYSIPILSNLLLYFIYLRKMMCIYYEFIKQTVYDLYRNKYISELLRNRENKLDYLYAYIRELLNIL